MESRRTSVRAGSVWESRMQSDDFKNGILRDDETDKKSKKEEDRGPVTGKLRTWKSGTRPPPTRSNRMSPVVQSDLKTRRSNSAVSVVVMKNKNITRSKSEPVEGVERGMPGRIRRAPSESSNEIVKSDESESVPLRKAQNSEDSKIQPDPGEGSEDDKEEPVVEEKPQNPDHEVKEFGVCEEKLVSTKNPNMDDGGEVEEEGKEKVDEKTAEEEKKRVDVNVMKETNKREVEEICKSKSFNQFRDRASPSYSPVGKAAPLVIKRASSLYLVPPNPKSTQGAIAAEEEQSFPQSHSKLQSLVDLVMWRDVSRSALVFGIGTFLIISSSYANDLNFSFISVVAYTGLVYLAANFIFRSVIHHRGEAEERGEVVGVVREEEVVKTVRLILPYLNDFLLTLTAFFSGDPSTTLKMGVALFVLARCGSSITIWKMAKLGFFVVFTVPKIFTSYSTYLSAYGEFWVRRMRDAWESCTHKKAVALALFTLLWNLSSLVARLWAAFMLFVALRYYQQRMMVNGGWREEEDQDQDQDQEEEEQEPPPKVLRKQTHHPHQEIFMIPNKLKKSS